MWGGREAMKAFAHRIVPFHVSETSKLAAVASFCVSPVIALDLKIGPEPVLQIAPVGASWFRIEWLSQGKSSPSVELHFPTFI